MDTSQIIFDPLLPWPVFWAVLVFASVAAGVAVWRRMSGWWMRAASLALLLLAIANPSLQNEEREPLSDIVILVVDESASQRISKPGPWARSS